MAGARFKLLILMLCVTVGGSVQFARADDSWARLSAGQRGLLAPLASDWPGMSEAQRQQWIGAVEGFERLTPEEQARIRARLREWADLSPEQRERARDQYRALRNIPPDQRERLYEEWQRYRSLSPEQRRSER